MLSDFFLTGPIPGNHLNGTYDPRLVVLSYLVAVFASYIALDIVGRLREPDNTKASRLLWLVGGSVAMGSGIWSMHFIGMLSFTIPQMSVYYEPFWTTISLLVAILASMFALFLLRKKIINITYLGLGAIVLGLGIAAMHYTGMQAMKIDMNIQYLPRLFLISILIAIGASEAAVWLALKSNQVAPRVRIRLKVVSAIIMGIAICGMHYTGMAAAIFTPKKNMMHSAIAFDPTILAIFIAGVTFVVLAIAFFASTYKEALNQQQIETARQLGMAEVSASILHNVGNVLNSVKVSANLIMEKNMTTKLKEIDNLNALLAEHKQDLGSFIIEDKRGKEIPNFLKLLANYWKEEQGFIANEMQIIHKNLQYIQEIISMQQDLIKTSNFEQIVSINSVLEEALLISDIDFTRHGILVEKQFTKLNSFLIDKVKLLQILVNLIKNAKDALKESSIENKLLVLKTGFINDEKIFIQVSDNGVGISPENMRKIFTHGFTTKEKGHGFGLHSSILAAREMNGDIKVASNGFGKGATFSFELPYKLPKL